MSAVPGTMRKALWGFRVVPGQLRRCTLVYSGPAGANDFMQLRGIVGGCGGVPADKKSEVLPPQAHPLGIGCPPTPSRQRLYGPKASGALHLSGALLRQDAKPKHQIIHGSVAGTLFEGPHGVPPLLPGAGGEGQCPTRPILVDPGCRCLLC